MKSENLLDRISRIAEAGTTFKQGRRVLSEGKNEAILPALLQEIDETVLARELTFHSDTDKSITLVAKGRRLWRICAAQPNSLIPKGADLKNANISGDDEAAMAALRKLMQEFAKSANMLSVSISETDPDNDYRAMGISVRMLRDMLTTAAAAADTAESNQLKGFVESLKAKALASAVMADDNLIYSSGTDKQIKLLESLLNDQLEAMNADTSKLQKTASRRNLIAMNRDSKYFIICARTSDQAALIVCKPDILPEIVSTWQQMESQL